MVGNVIFLLSLLLIYPPPLILWNCFMNEDCGAAWKEMELEERDLGIKDGVKSVGFRFFTVTQELLVVSKVLLFI